MSLRPVDMQVFLPKIEEVARNHHIQNQQEKTQQQQFAAQLQKQAEHQQKQVVGSNKSEGGKVDKDKDKEKEQNLKQGKDGKNGHEQEHQEEQTISLKDPSRGNLLDIKV